MLARGGVILGHVSHEEHFYSDSVVHVYRHVLSHVYIPYAYMFCMFGVYIDMCYTVTLSSLSFVPAYRPGGSPLCSRVNSLCYHYAQTVLPDDKIIQICTLLLLGLFIEAICEIA